MADEEKPTAEELAAQESAEFTDAIAAPSDGQDSADDAGEAVIAKNAGSCRRNRGRVGRCQ